MPAFDVSPSKAGRRPTVGSHRQGTHREEYGQASDEAAVGLDVGRDTVSGPAAAGPVDRLPAQRDSDQPVLAGSTMLLATETQPVGNGTAAAVSAAAASIVLTGLVRATAS